MNKRISGVWHWQFGADGLNLYHPNGWRRRFVVALRETTSCSLHRTADRPIQMKWLQSVQNSSTVARFARHCEPATTWRQSTRPPLPRSRHVRCETFSRLPYLRGNTSAVLLLHIFTFYSTKKRRPADTKHKIYQWFSRGKNLKAKPKPQPSRPRPDLRGQGHSSGDQRQSRLLSIRRFYDLVRK